MAEQRTIVTTSPENSETPLESLRSWVTPNRLFFVRNHFEVPELDASTWRLSVSGMVNSPRAWTYDELCALPQRTVFATIECAGNGRSFLRERAAGVQWGAGALGHAEWTGVPVRDLLRACDLQAEATEIIFEGADIGSEPDQPEPMAFARSLARAKALHPDTLIALSMNGERLEPDHGFPARLFVPGWYGVASVKWLTRMEAVNQPFPGYFQTKKYTYQRRSVRGLETAIVGPMRVKSEIIRPRLGEKVGLGTYRVFGLAWAGEDPIAGVELSTDGGRTWDTAELVGPRAPYSWSMWEYLWEIAVPGNYTLLARATSWSGQVQPPTHDPLHGGYMIHHSRPIDVLSESAARSSASSADPETWLYDMNAYAEEISHLPLDAEMEFMCGSGI